MATYLFTQSYVTLYFRVTLDQNTRSRFSLKITLPTYIYVRLRPKLCNDNHTLAPQSHKQHSSPSARHGNKTRQDSPHHRAIAPPVSAPMFPPLTRASALGASSGAGAPRPSVFCTCGRPLAPLQGTDPLMGGQRLICFSAQPFFALETRTATKERARHHAALRSSGAQAPTFLRTPTRLVCRNCRVKPLLLSGCGRSAGRLRARGFSAEYVGVSLLGLQD